MSKLISIDGSMLEGGGQILRLSLTISALCGIPIRVYNIRAGRSQPGLQAQHLKGLKLISEMTQAVVKGDVIGSTEIEFRPTSLHGGYYTADTQTAGSIGLLLQVALPCTYFTDNETNLKLKGGTNAEMAPQIDYTTEVFLPNLERFGATFEFDVKRRGYFPKGGGEVDIYAAPIHHLKQVTVLEQGDIIRIFGWSFVAGTLPMYVAHKMADSAIQVIEKAFPYTPVAVERYKEQPSLAIGNGSGIILVAKTSTHCILGSSALGHKNISTEETGASAAHELVNTFKEGACVDSHTQDQLIVFMALASGESQIRIGKLTQHTETAIYIVQQLTKAKFEVIPDGTSSILKCYGIALNNSNIN